MRRLRAWGVHALTAGGAVCALLALMAASDGRLRVTFAWLFAATLVDGVDGWIARLADVRRHLPHVEGDRLDDVVDFTTYVFVPAYLVAAGHVPVGSWALVTAAAMIVASAIGFARKAAKTADHFFTGFPSYWNIVVFYLLVLRVPEWLAAVTLLVLAGLVFAPVRFVYPSRTPRWQGLTVGLGLVWGVTVAAMIATFPDVPPAMAALSLVYPVYYVALSVWLDGSRRRT